MSRETKCIKVAECVLVQNIAAACNDIPECDLFDFFPLGKSSLTKTIIWGPSGILKTARPAYDNSKLLCVLALLAIA